MLTTTLKYLTPVTLLLLTACVPPSQAPVTSDDPLNQICKNLKQEIIMDYNKDIPSDGGQNPTVQARLYRQYDKYNCDEVLRRNAR